MLLAATVAALSLIVVLATYTIYYLLVRQGRLTLRLEVLEENLRQQGIAIEPVPERALGQPPGYVLHNFELADLSGESITMWQLRGGKVLLIFFNPACVHCRAMLPDLANLAADAQSDWPEPVIISTGSPEENRRLFAKYQIPFPILLQEKSEVAELFLVPGTPMGYLVDEKGETVGKLLVGSESLLAAARLGTSERVETRVGRDYSRSITRPSLRLGLAAGMAAPDFCLPALDGSEICLSRLRGQKVLLVFSDPACGPCNELAVKLQDIHRRSADLCILMIGRGDPEANRRKAVEHKITFPVALQRHWEVSREYAMFATPIGYLIDEEGILISNVLVGVELIVQAASAKETRTGARAKVLASS